MPSRDTCIQGLAACVCGAIYLLVLILAHLEVL